MKSFPFFSILALIFITLKVAGIGIVANWSWWLVLLPLYGSLIIFGLAVIVLMILTTHK